MLQLEETLHNVCVFSPGGMFWTWYCSEVILISNEMRRATAICSTVDDNVLIAELINEHIENTGIILPFLASSRWKVPRLGRKVGSPGQLQCGLCCLWRGTASTLLGNWIQSKTCLSPAAVCDLWLRHHERLLINDAFWTNLNMIVLPERSCKTYLA